MLIPERRKTSKQCYEYNEGDREDDDDHGLEDTHRNRDELMTANRIILVLLCCEYVG